MRITAFLVAATLVVGSATIEDAFGWQPDTREQLFTRLTAQAWDNNAPGASGHTEQLVLRRDGTYHWTRESDYKERDDAGNWSLVAHDTTSGLLRLSETGDLPFRFEGERLCLLSGQFRGGQAIAYDDRERKLNASDLKTVKPGEPFVRLASTIWLKTNPFDNFMVPERLEFLIDGHYKASYRGGTCQHGGLWGLEYRKRGGVDLISFADENSCDLRGGSAGLSHDLLRFSGDLLLNHGSYAPAGKKPTNTVFVVDRYGGTLVTRGEYVGSLRAGRPVKIEFMHETAEPGTLEMKSLEIGFQKSRIVPRGGETDGPVHWVLRKDLAGKSVYLGMPHSYAVEVTPPFAGDAAFIILPRFANSSQTFDAAESYQTTIDK